MTIPPTIEVANLGMWDSLILMVMALVVFGPRRLPEIARQVGKLMYEVRKASNDFKFQMEDELRKAEEEERRKKEEERVAALALAAPAPTPAPEVPALQTVEASAPAAATDSQAYDWKPYDELSRVSDAIPIQSPYPGEGVYPPVINPAAEAPAEVPYPQIQLPSTGIPVEANWESSRIQQIEALARAEAYVEAGTEAGAGEASAASPAVETAPVSESAAEPASHG
jgi:sec-independent protein translocase protein TatB